MARQGKDSHSLLRQGPFPLAEDSDRYHQKPGKGPHLGLNGTQEILIDSTKGAEQIRLTDKAGQVVRMNAAPGRKASAQPTRREASFYGWCRWQHHHQIDKPSID